MKATKIIFVFIFFLLTANAQQWTKTNIAVKGESRNMVIDKQGNIWYATGFAVWKFDGVNWTKYCEYNSTSNSGSIAIDDLGNKWVGTANGITKFNDTSQTSYNTTNGLISNSITCIAIDKKGNKWFGTANSGIMKYNDTTWTVFDEKDGLVSNSISSIAIDLQGNKWIGTFSEGVSRFNDSIWTTYTITNGLASNSIHIIGVDNQGNKWFGTENGISEYDGVNWKSFFTGSTYFYNWIYSIALDKRGRVWFGGDAVLYRFDGAEWKSFFPEFFPFLHAIAVDSNDNKWYLDKGFLCTMNEFPMKPSKPKGIEYICGNATKTTYSISEVTNSKSYKWNLLPTEAGTISGIGTIGTVSWNDTFNGIANITVKGINEKDTGQLSDALIVYHNLTTVPSDAGIITGSRSVCKDSVKVNYSVPPIVGATTYVWSLPSGAVGKSDTNSIQVCFGSMAASGKIVVKGNNCYGDGAESSLDIIVNRLPDAPKEISGDTLVRRSFLSVNYEITPVEGATNYIWSLPYGATGISNKNSISVVFGDNSVSGLIKVKANNGYCSGKESKLAISVIEIELFKGSEVKYDSIRQLNEINSSDYTYPWISDDGLRLYYTQSHWDRESIGELYYAERGNVSENFSKFSKLPFYSFSNPLSCWLTNDELNIFYFNSNTAWGKLYFASRNSRNDSFGSSTEIELNWEMFGWTELISPCFTRDLQQLFLLSHEYGECLGGVHCYDKKQIKVFKKTNSNEYTLVDTLKIPNGYSLNSSSGGMLTTDGLRYYVSLKNADGIKLYYYKRNTISEKFKELYSVENDLLKGIENPSISNSGNYLVFNKYENDYKTYIAYNFPVNVVFNTLGGTAIDSKSIEKYSLIDSVENPTKEGYTFAGWFKEPECSNAWNFATDSVISDITLYAKWNEVTAINNSNNKGIYMYPNPTSDKINIWFDDKSISDYTITIYNFLGIPVKTINKSKNDDQFSIDLSNYQTGVYLIQFSNITNCSYIKVLKQ
jgi:uncharacterized repeat protein (TIGR02543 family)